MVLFDNGLETLIGTFVFLRVNGQTLMMERNKQPNDFLYGHFVAPGGKFESGETPEQCAIREYREETGLTLGSVEYRGRIFFDNKKRKFLGKPAKFNFLVYVFEAYSYSGELHNDDPKGTPMWVPDGKLKTLKVEKGDPIMFDLLERKVPLNHRIALSDDGAEVYPLEQD